MTPQDFRLGNFIKKKGHKEHLRIIGLAKKFVIVGDGCNGEILNWDEVEPIECQEGDYAAISDMLGEERVISFDFRYLHQLQNEYYYKTKDELFA